MKKLVTAAIVVMFTLSVAGLSMAGTAKCKVDSVDGDKVTMTCDGADFSAGDQVMVKSKSRKAYEGC